MELQFTITLPYRLLTVIFFFLVALFSPVLSLALGSPYKSNLWQYTSRPVGFVSKSAIYVKTHRRGGEPREGSVVIVLNQGVEFLISYL